MRRHFSVTLTGWTVLILAAWNALRLWTSLAWSGVLAEYPAQLPMTVSKAMTAFWLVGGLVLFWSIWQKKPWSVKLLIGMAAGYTVWYWSEHFLSQTPKPNTFFAVIVNLILLVIIFFATRSLSREAYERNIEHPKTE